VWTKEMKLRDTPKKGRKRKKEVASDDSSSEEEKDDINDKDFGRSKRQARSADCKIETTASHVKPEAQKEEEDSFENANPSLTRIYHDNKSNDDELDMALLGLQQAGKLQYLVTQVSNYTKLF
jgi:hypothetical protein